MLDETKFPHFIPDKPQGEDVFEGKSQEHLAVSICKYIKLIDVDPGKKDVYNMSRIIGLEGGWGSGKSNVVRMIGDSLEKEGYYLFTYDAWGHQEDLQRRSILETLTKDLISNEVLSGKVTIKTRTGDTFTDSWDKQLQLLLSNKTIIKSHSVPSLSWSAIWAVLIAAVYGICLAIAEKIIGTDYSLKNNWWIYGIPFALAFFIGLIYLIRDDGSFKNAMKMVDKTVDDTTTFQYTSSEEPSISEFKNWMQAISNHLGKVSDCFLKKKKFRKLIIVFDNMDRLPSDKVMQLWSCIYAFFAGGEFENVWTIIPYDYKHLCQAISGGMDNDNQRIKRFINKTFPITYIIPQPVITDYEKLFYTYFDKAFGNKEHDRKHICQVFMRLRKTPNPRTVISFVNELVALRMQWTESKKYRLQNLALFILKKDFLFYNEGVETKDTTLESNLLSEDLFKDIAFYYPDHDGFIRRQMCQFAYGLEDEKLAGELPLRLELQRLLLEGNSIIDYVSHPNFVTVLENVLSNAKESELDNIVKSLASLDGVDFGEEQSSIQSKWDMLANQKVSRKYTKHEYDLTLDILVRHSTETRVKNLCRSFCCGMRDIKIEKGDIYFTSLYKFKCALKAIGSNINFFDYVKPVSTSPEHFIEFLNKAGKSYKDYKLTVNNQELNEYLLNNAISGIETSAIVFDQLKDDDNYSFEYLKENIAKSINADGIKDDIRPAAYINRVLDEENGIIQNRYTSTTISSFLKAANIQWDDRSSLGSEDVLAMYLADGNDFPDLNESILPRLSGCIERYISSDVLLTHLGSSGTAYNKLNVYMIQNQKGQYINFSYFAKYTLLLRDKLGLEVKALLAYSNGWEFEEIKDLTSSNIQEYLHQELFADYMKYDGNFTEGLIKQGVSILETQEEGFLIKISPVPGNPGIQRMKVDPYWKQFVLCFVGTKFFPRLNDLLTKELITMLNRVIDSNTVDEQELLNFLLSHRPIDRLLKEHLNKVMNNEFTKTDITPLKFNVYGGLIPLLTANMDVNTARNLSIHFVKPIYNDKECAKIIVKNKDFYLDILAKDASVVQDVFKGMLENAEISDIYEEIRKEIEELLIAEEDDKEESETSIRE